MSTDTIDRSLVVIVVLVIALLLGLPVLLMGFGMGAMGPMMGPGWGHGMWNGTSAPGWVLLVGLGVRLLGLLVVAGLGYLGYRALVGRSGSTDQAMEALRVAYARGELSDEEYERRRETLQRDE